MKNYLYFLMILILALQSCKKDINYSNYSYKDTLREDFDPYSMDIMDDDDVETFKDLTGDYPDGEYCAEIEYYNPKTGTRSDYDLDVEIEDGYLVKIHWANGGWLDNSHYSNPYINDGYTSFISDKGYHYDVELGSYGGCYSSDQYSFRRDISEDEDMICPKCGDVKDSSYDEYCYWCQSDIDDHTCEECGGYKNFSTDEYCDSCDRRINHTCENCGGYKYSEYDDLCSSCENEENDEWF